MPDGAAMTLTEFTPDAANARAFRDALGCFATGVTLVTAATEHGPMGFLANSFASVSIDPPLVLWSPAKNSSRFMHYAGARDYAIHVLGDAHTDWLRRFSRGGEGFAGLSHRFSPEGVPVIDAALARFDCQQHATHDGGDHLIVVGRVIRAAFRSGAPLVFSQGNYGGFAFDDPTG
jgi:flavin reductase (DIM6/NTAB) family NADH-FMN oxidoreductase RutF